MVSPSELYRWLASPAHTSRGQPVKIHTQEAIGSQHAAIASTIAEHAAARLPLRFRYISGWREATSRCRRFRPIVLSSMMTHSLCLRWHHGRVRVNQRD